MASLRVSDRLSRQKKPPEPEEEPASTSFASCADLHHDGLSPGAKRNKKYRQRIKEDPVQYKIYREKETKRLKTSKAQRTPEQIATHREKTRIRVQDWREKQKELGRTPKSPKPQTRAKKEEKREKDRLRQQRYRAGLKLRPQKQGWITKRKQQAKQQKSVNQMQKDGEETTESTAEVCTPISKSVISAYLPSSRSKAVKKAKENLPSDPQKYAEVIHRLIETKSPRKKQALAEKNILQHSTRKELEYPSAVLDEIGKHYEELKRSKKSVHSKTRATLGTILMGASKGRNSVSHIRKKYGLSFHFLMKCRTQNFNRKRPSNALSAETATKVVDYYKRGDVSRCDPSPASVSAKTHQPKRFMEKTLKEAHKAFVEEENIKISFSQFAKLRPKTTKTVRHTKMNFCCCEYCANIKMKQEAINNFLSSKGHHNLHLPSKYELSALTLCAKNEDNGQYKKSCLDRKCRACGVAAIRDKIQPALDQYADAMVTWKKWCQVQQEIHDKTGTAKLTSKKMLTSSSGPLDEILTELQAELGSFACHITNAEWQHRMFANLKVKENLPNNWILICMDFAENFGCFYQDEVQGVHWTRQQVTIHPIVAYYHCPDDGDITTESMVFISDDLTHDSHAVHHFETCAMTDLKSRGLHFTKVIHFSDGCASQYKGRISFADATHGAEDTGVPVEKHFFGSRHGKGPCDAEIGVVKRVVGTAIKARRAEVANAKEMFNFCKATLTRPATLDVHCHNRRKFIFIPRGTINRDRPDRAGADVKSVEGTRSLHCSRGLMPYVLRIRERSCFCQACISEEGECRNQAFCGDWTVAHLKKRSTRRRRRRRNGKSHLFFHQIF